MSKFYPDLYTSPLANDYYSLLIKQQSFRTEITMSLFTSFYHTNSMPNTFEELHENLPGVLRSKCFNEDNLPFATEVLNTEIGHLFEHILLEYLCSTKISKGAKRALFRGLTSWNWRKDTKGTFHITIYMNPEDLEIFSLALNKTVILMNLILKKSLVN